MVSYIWPPRETDRYAEKESNETEKFSVSLRFAYSVEPWSYYAGPHNNSKVEQFL